MGGLTAAQQAPVDKLRPNALSDCAGYPDGEGDDVTAAVVCSAGNEHSVQAFAFPDQAARSRDAQARGAGLSRAGRCANGDDLASTWVFNNVIQGDLICVHEQDRYAIYWTHNSDLIGFRIDDAADGTSLYSFWLGFEPI
ncbi:MULTISPECIES: hypothetical protein [unclassified Parafrankia]|uniref:hypothetical protein n=1 Tax=unclassified Parafrankia TaxID=2994368 RepID=UPI000DA56E05|nr:MULTISPECIES: hypothetical protein [unclassified Parafrankia]TCJ37617.1 hypothetical protein E0504_17855 [Parafrankia sp. BMG5.11]SQD99748.1 hypothetical protein FMEAI12_5590016 [Parafrankia sp. Ea1.12]